MSRLPRLSALLCACILAVHADRANALLNQFTETFTTTTYRLSATADWNTSLGQLQLFPFTHQSVGGYSGWDFNDVAVAGDLAFATDEDYGFHVFSITYPPAGQLINDYGYGASYGVAVAGNFLFVAMGATGLRIFDITNPFAVTAAGSYNTPGFARNVVVAGDLAFVADENGGLQIINIANPASPSLTGSYTGTNVFDVKVAGDRAFLACSSGLRVLNIISPNAPTLLGSANVPWELYSVAIAGVHAFTGGFTGLDVFIISNPALPTLAAHLVQPDTATDVAVTGNLAVVTIDNYGVRFFDITNPSSPALLGTSTSADGNGVAVAGEFAFVASGWDGVRTVNLHHAMDVPYYIGQTVNSAEDIVVDGNLAYLASGSSGLRVINIQNVASPVQLGTYATPSNAVGVAVSGDLAFLALQSHGLQIVNVTNPAAPTLVGSYNPGGTTYDVAVSGDYAFLAHSAGDLIVLDILDPAFPAGLGMWSGPGTHTRVAIDGDYAFLGETSGLNGFKIINITNPATPTLLSTLNTGGQTRGLAISGDLAFVCDTVQGIKVVDITSPSSPTIIGSYSASDLQGIALDGDRLYATGAGSSEFSIFDVAIPAAPSLIHQQVAPYISQALAVDGDHAFLATSSGAVVMQVYQREFDRVNNSAMSHVVSEGAEPIHQVRLSASYNASVNWEVILLDGGWTPVVPDNSWTPVAGGNGLIWRADLKSTQPGVNAAILDMHLEWPASGGHINSITDIPNDQGRWMRVNFMRAGRDFAAQTTEPIANYGIWRRVAAPLLLTSAPVNDAEIQKAFGGLPLQTSGNRVFMISSVRDPLGAQFPQGTWELVQAVPALQQQNYLATIPTEADSPAYTAVVITAHTTTPSLWFVSSPDSGLSIDNLAPSVPQNLTVAYNSPGGNALSWNPSPDADFQYFRVYRSTVANFTPSPVTLAHSTIDHDWVDPDYHAGGIYYKVTATDFAGNESGAASAGAVTAVEQSAAPKTFALYPNVPNPFNPTTRIRYDVPVGGGDVSLVVYDVNGRTIRVLASGRQNAGEKSLSWDGRDRAGQPVASGVYFYRLTAPGYTMTHKMMLMK